MDKGQTARWRPEPLHFELMEPAKANLPTILGSLFTIGDLPSMLKPAKCFWHPKNAIYLSLGELPTSPSQRMVFGLVLAGSSPSPHPTLSSPVGPARRRQIELIWRQKGHIMQANTFDVIERRKRITFFKLGKLWVFKQFFDNRALFDALLDYFNKDQYRFEFKSIGARNNALKLLERNDFDYDLVEDLTSYVGR